MSLNQIIFSILIYRGGSYSVIITGVFIYCKMFSSSNLHQHFEPSVKSHHLQDSTNIDDEWVSACILLGNAEHELEQHRDLERIDHETQRRIASEIIIQNKINTKSRFVILNEPISKEYKRAENY